MKEVMNSVLMDIMEPVKNVMSMELIVLHKLKNFKNKFLEI